LLVRTSPWKADQVTFPASDLGAKLSFSPLKDHEQLGCWLGHPRWKVDQVHFGPRWKISLKPRRNALLKHLPPRIANFLASLLKKKNKNKNKNKKKIGQDRDESLVPTRKSDPISVFDKLASLIGL
jgi:hypothetical protein